MCRSLRLSTRSWNLMWWMIANEQTCQGGDGNVLRKYARRIASVIVFLIRQEGNTIVRGQQEQLAVTKMVNEAA